jgi:SAM-dependent methyltransferase
VSKAAVRVTVERDVIDRITAKWMHHAPRLWWGDRLDARFLVADALRSLRGARVLDVGCNAGVMLSEIPPANARFGIDRSEDAIRLARKLDPSLGLVLGDLLALPFRDSSFDVVVLCGMLEVVPRERKAHAVGEVGRVLRPKGHVYLTTLNRRYPRYKHDARKVVYEELCDLLSPAFDCEIKGFNPFPPFPYFLPNRLLVRVPGIWRILCALTEWNFGRSRSRAFIARAEKR